MPWRLLFFHSVVGIFEGSNVTLNSFRHTNKMAEDKCGALYHKGEILDTAYSVCVEGDIAPTGVIHLI